MRRFAALHGPRPPAKRLRPAARLRQALVRALGPGDGVLERERALRQAIAALVGAPDRDAVLDAGLAAVADLLGPGARAVIAVIGEHGIVLRGEELPGATPRLPLRGGKPQGVLAIEADGRLDARHARRWASLPTPSPRRWSASASPPPRPAATATRGTAR